MPVVVYVLHGKGMLGICLVHFFIVLQPATDRITPAEEGQRDCTGRDLRTPQSVTGGSNQTKSNVTGQKGRTKQRPRLPPSSCKIFGLYKLDEKKEIKVGVWFLCKRSENIK